MKSVCSECNGKKNINKEMSYPCHSCENKTVDYCTFCKNTKIVAFNVEIICPKCHGKGYTSSSFLSLSRLIK